MEGVERVGRSGMSVFSHNSHCQSLYDRPSSPPFILCGLHSVCVCACRSPTVDLPRVTAYSVGPFGRGCMSARSCIHIHPSHCTAQSVPRLVSLLLSVASSEESQLASTGRTRKSSGCPFTVSHCQVTLSVTRSRSLTHFLLCICTRSS